MKNPQPQKSRRVYPVPLLRAARALGCSYTHLWLVMNDRRHSERLKRRYAALVKKTAKEMEAAA